MEMEWVNEMRKVALIIIFSPFLQSNAAILHHGGLNKKKDCVFNRKYLSQRPSCQFLPNGPAHHA